ncbi:unnamed protein product [Calicophoron daubneyi]|uniref:Glutamate-rich protein 2 n=1 Tax=Calicophoron daubneyi TaxID=300641 RepID=A0AAV2TRQ3_CALDB
MSTDQTAICSTTSANGTAPPEGSLELFLEFLNCVMNQDFAQALVLCRQILEVEPENEEAKQFLPLLTEANHMKSTGFFQPRSQSVSSESDMERDNHREEESTSSDSSDDFDYSTTDSDSDSQDSDYN